MSNTTEAIDYKDITPGYKITNPKIDIYQKGEYVASTNWYLNIKHAKARHDSAKGYTFKICNK